MFPLFKKPRKESSPLLRDIPSVISGRQWANVSCIFSLCGLLLFPSIDSKAATGVVKWGNADWWEIQGGLNGLTMMEFYGLNGAGAGAAKLAQDVYGTLPAVSTSGDLVELGYFASDAAGTPSAVTGDLFRGNYWIPLTSTTRIGMLSNGADSDENAAGRILPTATQFTSGSNIAKTNYAVADYKREDTNPYSGATLSDVVAKLDTADGAGDAFLAMRFYDVNPASSSGAQGALSSGTSRYNTITNPAWKWRATSDTPTDVVMTVHSPLGPDNTDGTGDDNSVANYDMELDSDDYSGVKIGSGNTLGTGDSDTVRTATITYRTGALTLAADTIVSNLDNAVSTANITGDAGTAYDLTVLAPSAGADASTDYTYSGVISNKTNIHKVGAGTQEFTGAINTTGILSIDEAALILKPGNITQSFEYLTDDGTPGTLAIDNSGGANHVVELGFASTTTAQTFAGAVALSGSGANAIRVASGTADADYGKEQVFSGVVSGAATLEKKGVGRLNLTGSNTLTGNVNVDDGTLVVGNNNALGQGGEATTVTINKGKLEVALGITTSSDVTIQGGASRNFIGGDGTVNSVVIGSGANEVDVVSPGQGFASSLNLANKQAVRGNTAGTASTGDDADASIGTFTASALSLLDGGVFDWEIKDFDGSGGTGSGADGDAGTNWDLLKFDNLTFVDGGNFNINVYGIKSSDGTAGAPDDSALWAKSGESFLFLSDTSGSDITWGSSGATPWDAQTIDDYFTVYDADLAKSTNMWGGDWEVTYNSGNFYLNFSAVPEPSTYVMVTGLLMLPGFQFLRRFRKRKNKGEE
jgi:autotransporter-associated beta strand protein